MRLHLWAGLIMAALAASSLQLLSPPMRSGPEVAHEAMSTRSSRHMSLGGVAALEGSELNGATACGCPAACSCYVDPPRQLLLCKGASVFYSTDSWQGFAVLERRGEPDYTGTPTWYIQRPGVQRSRAIRECNLDLCPISHLQRRPPSGLDQPVLIMAGAHVGKTGKTQSKVGERYTCEVEGEAHRASLKPDWLHATGPPGHALSVPDFGPTLLATIPRAEMAAFHYHYTNDATTMADLIRHKPDSVVWHDVQASICSVDSLTDDEVRQLHYEATGLGPSMEELSVDEIRRGLHRAAVGKWTVKWRCSHHLKCSCPFALEYRHDGSGIVEVWQTGAHEFHNPSSAADLTELKLHPKLRERAEALLRGNVKTAHVHGTLVTDLMAGRIEGIRPEDLTYTNARLMPSQQQIQAIAKALRRADGYANSTADPAAMAALMAQLAACGCQVEWQPYVAPCGEGSKGTPLFAVVQTPYQKKMLNAFGRRLVFLDATGSTNKYNYMLHSVAVQDEDGSAQPVGFMISTSNDSDVVARFLRALRNGAREVGDGDFTYGHIMIDKATAEIAAVKELMACGEAEGWLLCYFHLLQEWERFGRSTAESGIEDKVLRHRLLLSVSKLVHIEEKTVFEAELTSWCTTWRDYPKVVAKMKASWAPCANHWAWHGRTGLLDLRANTNNLIERVWGTIKYIDLSRKTQYTLYELFRLLMERTVPRYMHNRGLTLAGRRTSDQRRAEQRTAKVVEELVEKVRALAMEGYPGLAAVGSKRVCVGDLSCTCEYSAERPCLHMRAAALKVGYTPALRCETAAHLVPRIMVVCNKVEEGESLCQVATLADPQKTVFFRPHDAFCTCHGRALHSTCCHLLAAPLLPEFAGADLHIACYAAPDEESEERLDVGSGRTFQPPPAVEPLGEAEGLAELHQIAEKIGAAAEDVRRSSPNEDPEVAAMSVTLAAIKRSFVSLPAGDPARQEMKDGADRLRQVGEGAVKEAGLPLTEGAAGKKARKKQSRGAEVEEGAAPGALRTMRPQQAGRKRSARGTLMQQQAGGSYDLYPTIGRPHHEEQIRGLTVPGNINATVARRSSSRPSVRMTKGRREKVAEAAVEHQLGY